MLDGMIEDRRRILPDVRLHNPLVSPAVASIADKQRVQEFYTVEEFAKIVGRSCFGSSGKRAFRS